VHDRRCENSIGCVVNFGSDWRCLGCILFGNRGAVIVGEIDGSVRERARAMVEQASRPAGSQGKSSRLMEADHDRPRHRPATRRADKLASNTGRGFAFFRITAAGGEVVGAFLKVKVEEPADRCPQTADELVRGRTVIAKSRPVPR
jgi:hypothetical protein